MKYLIYLSLIWNLILIVVAIHQNTEIKRIEERHYAMIVYTLDELRTFERGQVVLNQKVLKKLEEKP